MTSPDRWPSVTSSRSVTPRSSSPSASASSSPRRRSSPQCPTATPGLEHFGGIFGTIVSAAFLFLIGLLNLVVLAGIIGVFRAMRQGEYDEAELERQLENRGLMYRFFGRWMRPITKEWQMYPVGVVFGMGFDTATEVALLATTALLATQPPARGTRSCACRSSSPRG